MSKMKKPREVEVVEMDREVEVVEMEVAERDALYQCVAELLSIHCQFGDRQNAIKHSIGLSDVEDHIGLDHVLRVLDKLHDKEVDKEKVITIDIEALSKKVSITAPILKYLNFREVLNRIEHDFDSVFGDGTVIDLNSPVRDFLSDNNPEEDLTELIYNIEKSLHVKLGMPKQDFKRMSVMQLAECLSFVSNRVNSLASPIRGKTAKAKKKA